MTATAETPPRRIPAGAPHFRGVWNGRHELAPDPSGRPGAVAVSIRRGTAAAALPGRAAVGVLGAPRRASLPRATG